MLSLLETVVAQRGTKKMSALTATEARVIAAISSQSTLDEHTLLKVVAAETQVSEATVVKLAKKLGFDGFRSLRATLVGRNTAPLAIAHEELVGEPANTSLSERVFQTSIQALQSTFAALRDEDVRLAARWICTAAQRDFYGVGGSAQVARDASFKFLRIGLRTSAFEDGSTMLMSAALLQKGDAVVAFSYSGQTTAVIEAVRQARKNGARVVAVTNSIDSRLSQEADLTLRASTADSPLTGESAAARLSLMALLDVLFLAVAKVNPAKTEANLRRTMPAVRTRRTSW